MMRQHELNEILRFEQSANGNNEHDTFKDLVDGTDTESAYEIINEYLCSDDTMTDTEMQRTVRSTLDYLSFSTNVIHDAMDYLDRMLHQEAAYAITS